MYDTEKNREKSVFLIKWEKNPLVQSTLRELP